MNPQDQAAIKALPGNDVCADCGASNPEWAASSHGILVCIHCSGAHRSLGTHLSFVKSVTMDTWTDKQLQIMKLGGNQACNEFLVQKHGITTSDIREKYSSPAARLYKQVLIARYENKPEPTVLPPPLESTTNKKSKYQGFGSSPPPPPQRQGIFSKRNLTKSVIVLGVAVATAAFLFLPSSQALSTQSIQSFYNTVGPALDLMSIVEDEPREYALDKARVGQTCKSIFEIGCGTGRTAEKILKQDDSNSIESYTCMDVSSRMVDLTRTRLDKYRDGGNVDVQVLEQNALETNWPRDVDCIFAFYVLDIMSENDIDVFLSKAHESLTAREETSDGNDGRLVLTSITSPTSGMWSKLVMSTWQAIANRFPLLLGGCRPIELHKYLSPSEWNVLECKQISVLGYTSEIIIANPRGVVDNAEESIE